LAKPDETVVVQAHYRLWPFGRTSSNEFKGVQQQGHHLPAAAPGFHEEVLELAD
jgi:hypothetical protein